MIARNDDEISAEFLRRVGAGVAARSTDLRDALQRHVPTTGCAEAWPNLPPGAAGAAHPPPPASQASRRPGAGRLLLRALGLVALALYVATALGLVCLSGMGDQ